MSFYDTRAYGAALRNGDRATYLRGYEEHNPGAMHHPDPQVRTYGKCGCGLCVEVRTIEQFGNRPMNKQGRGEHRMSSINMCDRCGALVQGAAVGAVSLVTGSGPKAERLDKEICPGCVDQFVKLIESSPAPQQQAYKEAWKRPRKTAKGMGELTDVSTEALLATVMERQLYTKAIEAE